MRKDGKRGHGTVIVAAQSCFHRDRLDGEPNGLNLLALHLRLNGQVVGREDQCRCMTLGQDDTKREPGQGNASR
jgi:hypothetical protein